MACKTHSPMRKPAKIILNKFHDDVVARLVNGKLCGTDRDHFISVARGMYEAGTVVCRDWRSMTDFVESHI